MEPNLGQTPNGAYRDAIHIAVICVVAGEDLLVGQDVSVEKSIAFGRSGSGGDIGVVDPFLELNLDKGDQFWLFLYPNTVTSMQHHWEHPSFNPQAIPPSGNYGDPEGVSKRFLEALCATYGVRWSDFEYAYVEGEGIHMGENDSANDMKDDPDFLWHFQNVFGKPPHEDGYFSCAC